MVPLIYYIVIIEQANFNCQLLFIIIMKICCFSMKDNINFEKEGFKRNNQHFINISKVVGLFLLKASQS